MTGDAEGAQLEPLKIQRKVSGGLGPIQNEGDAAPGGDGSDGLRILHGAGHVGAMGHDDQFRVGANEGRDSGRVDKAVPISRDPVEGDFGKLQQA